MQRFRLLCPSSKLLLFLCLCSFVVNASQQANRLAISAKPIDLEPGKPIARQLSGGEVHTYRMVLTAGQLVDLRIRQQGVDLSVVARNSVGDKIAEFDNQQGNLGVETISILAESAGIYQFDIKVREQVLQCGGYTIENVDVRESSARDRRLNAARLVLNEGRLLLRSGKPQLVQEAIAKVKEALMVFTAEDEPAQQIQGLQFLGLAYSNLVDRKQALEQYTQALKLSQRVGNRDAEAEALSGVAISQLGISTEPKWLDLLTEALQIKEETGDLLWQAHILNYFAAAYYNLTQYQKSLEYRNQALTIFRRLKYPEAEFNTLIALGTTYTSLGERQRALDYFHQAAAISRDSRNPARQGEVLAKIGAVYYGMVDYLTALKYYKNGLSLSQAANDRYTICRLLDFIGSTYVAMGQYEEGRTYLLRAIEMAREDNRPELENGALRNLALIEAHLGNPGKAREYFDREWQLYKAQGLRTGQALNLYVRAEFERDQGNYELAIEHLTAALKIKEAISANISVPELRTTFFAKIRGMYELYMDILMLMHKRNPEKKYNEEALRISEMSRARSLLESLGESRLNIREGVDARLLDAERRLQQQLNERADDLLQLQLNRADAVQINAVTKDINDLTAKYQETERRIRETAPHYTALTQPLSLTVSEIQQQILDDDTVLLEYMLSRKRCYVWAISKDSIDSYELTGRVAIELASRNVYSQLTARNKCVQFETVDEWQERIGKADGEFQKAAAALSQLLLAPVARHLHKKRILIVCDSSLQSIPFAALPTPAVEGQKSEAVPLMVEHEIINLPSASTLAVLRAELSGRKPAPKTLAIFGDPVFEQSDSRLFANPSAPAQRLAVDRSQPNAKESPVVRLTRLPFTRKEVESIGALVPANLKKSALDFEANRTAATDSSLSQYRYIHFATHGIIDSARPELSGIALSRFNKQGLEQEGFLRLYDIFNLRLPAELVVLSGCRTGLGKELRGEGLIGLTRGFMYAGAARVMVSLWDIDDEATAEFMSRFYKALWVQKLTPAAALRATQNSFANDKRWSSPFYWAAFVLQGEPK
jgi:CHAT domain-containing protein